MVVPSSSVVRPNVRGQPQHANTLEYCSYRGRKRKPDNVRGATLYA